MEEFMDLEKKIDDFILKSIRGAYERVSIDSIVRKAQKEFCSPQYSHKAIKTMVLKRKRRAVKAGIIARSDKWVAKNDALTWEEIVNYFN